MDWSAVRRQEPQPWVRSPPPEERRVGQASVRQAAPKARLPPEPAAQQLATPRGRQVQPGRPAQRPMEPEVRPWERLGAAAWLDGRADWRLPAAALPGVKAGLVQPQGRVEAGEAAPSAPILWVAEPPGAASRPVMRQPRPEPAGPHWLPVAPGRQHCTHYTGPALPPPEPWQDRRGRWQRNSGR